MSTGLLELAKRDLKRVIATIRQAISDESDYKIQLEALTLLSTIDKLTEDERKLELKYLMISKCTVNGVVDKQKQISWLIQENKLKEVIELLHEEKCEDHRSLLLSLCQLACNMEVTMPALEKERQLVSEFISAYRNKSLVQFIGAHIRNRDMISFDEALVILAIRLQCLC